MLYLVHAVADFETAKGVFLVLNVLLLLLDVVNISYIVFIYFFEHQQLLVVIVEMRVRFIVKGESVFELHDVVHVIIKEQAELYLETFVVFHRFPVVDTVPFSEKPVEVICL